MPTPNQLLHDAHWHRYWQWLLLAFAALSAGFAFAPSELQTATTVPDKAAHLAAFAAMGIAAALAQPAGRRQAQKAAVGLVGYGAFIELVQSTLPTRSAEAADLLADALGAAVGLLLAHLLRRVWPSPIAA